MFMMGIMTIEVLFTMVMVLSVGEVQVGVEIFHHHHTGVSNRTGEILAGKRWDPHISEVKGSLETITIFL